MKTPFMIPQDRVDFWKMQCGCKVISGPVANVVVAMPTKQEPQQGWFFALLRHALMLHIATTAEAGERA